MKKTSILFFVLSFCLFGCNNKEKKVILNDEFRRNISNYIDKNPIRVSMKGKKISYPSYHIYFDKKENDTVFAIKLMPHLTPFNLLKYHETKDTSMFFSEIKPKGYFLFKPKVPVVVFDDESYSKNVIDGKMLKKEIPDSLVFSTEKDNLHIKSNMEFFKVN
ncbi:hypothetical protein [Tenacibaculum maritimum]|uniref:hypothetical protein n=1 Tax=Tenacibaculum maritimum TaxID=107401 RepID=UPI0010A2EE34|nr:hypothetical protein [Tenacibaculum maritimum]